MPIYDNFGPPPFIAVFLSELARVLTRGAPHAEAVPVIAQVLARSPSVTEASLRDALVSILEEEDRFPSTACILRHAKRRAAGKTPQEASDAIPPQKALEEALAVERLWWRKFEKDGNEYGMRVSEKRGKGISGRLDREQGFDAYDHADAESLVTGRWQGVPNRAMVAGYTGNEHFLTRKGNADPSAYVTRLTGAKVGEVMP